MNVRMVGVLMRVNDISIKGTIELITGTAYQMVMFRRGRPAIHVVVTGPGSPVACYTRSLYQQARTEKREMTREKSSPIRILIPFLHPLYLTQCHPISHITSVLLRIQILIIKRRYT